MPGEMPERKKRPTQADRILQWDRMLAEAINEKRSFTEVMETGRLFLTYPYALAGSNLEYLYATAEYIKEIEDRLEINENEGKTSIGLANFAAQELFLDKKYHEDAKKNSLFYYYSENIDRTDLCCNIFLNGKYYARMFLSLPGGLKKVPSEEEALFLFFCRRIENLLTSIPGFLNRQQDDSMHSCLQAIGSGQNVPVDIFEKAAEDAGFKSTDTFCLIYLSFYSDEGWKAQYETTLPYLAYALEAKWKYSCAVPVRDDLVWLVDINRSEANVKSRSFYQELAFFLRENICKAGVSSRFSGFESIFYAVRQAKAALDIGNAVQPSFWYYLFDDYRLYYMLNKAAEEIPRDYLASNPVRTLKEYDKEKNAELYSTLKTYLRCSQNDSRTAEALHVHRSTLYRRLERIHQLTGLRLDHPDTVLELLLVMRMDEI